MNRSLDFLFRTILLSLAATCLLREAVYAQEVSPVLEFPQPGMDDESAYRGYRTRFFRDSDGNAVQQSINHTTGRVVHLWADAADESISFTARETNGKPAKLFWGSKSAIVQSEGKRRYLECTLSAEPSTIDIGLFVLASMRKERGFQYHQKHLLPFDSKSYIEEELTRLISNLERLSTEERSHHLALLRAESVEELRTRLQPSLTSSMHGSHWVVSVKQPRFDGKNLLSLELRGDTTESSVQVLKNHVSIRSKTNQQIQLRVKIGTDSPSLTPLTGEKIFNSEFRNFYNRVKEEHDTILRGSETPNKSASDKHAVQRFQWLERQVKSLELLSYEEKLMAGLPNFATYFGRDMMMSALMMEPIWKPEMLEHVIASVLRKLRRNGEVSHEESLGGQAIRENAAEYNALIDQYFALKEDGDGALVDSVLALAENILRDLQKVRENYMMLDDDFQLPVLVGRYLTREDIPTDRKRAFLLTTSAEHQGRSRLSLLFLNFKYVIDLAAPYVEHPDVLHLVSFPKTSGRWFPGSWRDSGAGYANGRFAMDINVVWVPMALESISHLVVALHQMGFSPESLKLHASEIEATLLFQYLANPASLGKAVRVWRGSAQHFLVRLSENEVQKRVEAKLNWLSETERLHWSQLAVRKDGQAQGIEFYALSLDSAGKPIRIVNTDPATWLFLHNFASNIQAGSARLKDVLTILNPFLMPYPVGLFVAGLGPLAANDVYASPAVWESFKRDEYHSPRVVWGREVNLFLLGLAKQLQEAVNLQGQPKKVSLTKYVQELRAALQKTVRAVEVSGLKHNELWTYRIEGQKLLAVRYATSSDIQLWNLTDLSVQFLLDQIGVGR